MSGGRYNYIQYQLEEVYNDIETSVEFSGQKREKLSRYCDKDCEYTCCNYEELSEEVKEVFMKAAKAIRIAEVYIHEVDWFMSGDTGEESLIKRTKEKLKEIEVLEHLWQKEKIEDL